MKSKIVVRQQGKKKNCRLNSQLAGLRSPGIFSTSKTVLSTTRFRFTTLELRPFSLALKGLCQGNLLFARQNFTNTILYRLYLWVIYFFEHEKKICDKFLRKDLSKVDSGPKTRSVQSENLKSWPTFSS